MEVRMSTVESTFDIHDLRELVAAGDAEGFGAFLADDVVWSVIDQRTPPAAPAVLHGRGEVVGVIRDAVARDIVTDVTDGFTAGDRGALQLTCTYPNGGQVVENALVEIRDGRIARWSGVQAWDE
jgi:ketosteroid isomerase-like protein